MARFVMVASILMLTAVPLAGCGGDDDQAKVEASLQHYLVSLGPEDGPFPIGAGTPQVKDNGCKDRHVKIEKAHVLSTRNLHVKIGKVVAIWACVVKFGTLAMPVVVAVDDGTDVVAASPGVFKRFKPK